MQIRILDPNKDEKILFDIVKLEDKIFKLASIGNYNIMPMARYGRVYALLDNDNIVSVVEVMSSFERDLAYIYGVFTNYEYRGMGMANKILSFVMDDLKKDGIKKIQLTTELDNIANKLYKKLGFEVISILEDEYKDGERRYLYEALLHE